MSRREKIEHMIISIYLFVCLFVTKDANRESSCCDRLTKRCGLFVCLSPYFQSPPKDLSIIASKFHKSVDESHFEASTLPLIQSRIGYQTIRVTFMICWWIILLFEFYFCSVMQWHAFSQDFVCPFIWCKKMWEYPISLVEFFPPKRDVMRGESYLHC